MEMFKCYFEYCYPYCPVIDRLELLQSFDSRRCSTFLVQAVLASAAQFAPIELLVNCGFVNRLAAQKAFTSKAILLYDLGCEKSQLRLLQGSLLLGTTPFHTASSKDFRYWLHNTARIATQMGLHKRLLSKLMLHQ
jgi:hypothetical protein